MMTVMSTLRLIAPSAAPERAGYLARSRRASRVVLSVSWWMMEDIRAGRRSGGDALAGKERRVRLRDVGLRDVRAAAGGSDWIKMIVPDEAAPDVVAGNVVLWSHDERGEPVSEIGWMVLPEFQGRGLGKRAVRMLLELARDDGRWGLVHAFPATSNAPSKGICRSLGFRFAGERDVTFADRVLRSNHWVINPAADLA